VLCRVWLHCSRSLRRFDYPTVLQHNTPARRDSVQARCTSTWLGNGYETNLSPLDMFCSVTSRTWFWSSAITSVSILYILLRSIKGEFPFVRCWFQMPFLNGKALSFNKKYQTQTTLCFSYARRIVILRNVSTSNSVSVAPSISVREGDCRKYDFLTASHERSGITNKGGQCCST